MRHLRILCYHEVTQAEDGGGSSCRSMPTVEEFGAQMRFLKERHRVISLDEVAEHCAGGTRPSEFSVAVTFDDGMASVALAASVMLELELPMAVFLPTRYIGSDELPWFTYLGAIIDRARARNVALEAAGQKLNLTHRTDLKRFRSMAKELLLNASSRRQTELLETWAAACGMTLGEVRQGPRRFLDWRQVGQLASQGVSFASHTWSHVDLCTLSQTELEEEFSRAKTDIVKNLGPQYARFVAYPDGRFDQRVLETARRYHEVGFADKYRYASWGDVRRLPRRGVNHGGLAALRRELSGPRELASWAKQRVRSLLCADLPGGWSETQMADEGLVVSGGRPEK
jgi:peptidoglycan/xylan/chitin deacetylase (PgdA/CDA1 family)